MTGTTENYFSAIEDAFRAARGTPLFMLSPLDWALMDAWKGGGIPLAAVLRGIDTSFERWRRKPSWARTRGINSLAYCASAVAEEAQTIVSATPIGRSDGAAPFNLDDLRAFIVRNAADLRTGGYSDLAESLDSIVLESLYSDLEQLEQRLTAIEEQMIGRLRDAASEDALSEARRALDRDLRPYRGKMTADQLARLEKQFFERQLLESAHLPRLSLFYL